mgnify:CR=1 FL=1
MWDEVFSVALTNGIFACLFVALLVYELKDSRQREKKYQKTIDVLSSRLVTVEKVKEDVDEIKQAVVQKKKKKSNENI